MPMKKQRDKDLEIWRSSEWMKRRKEARGLLKQYKGDPLLETIDKRDRHDGEMIRRFPLGINFPKLACEVHKDIARGTTTGDAKPLVVRCLVDRDGTSAHPRYIEELVNKHVWRPSHGASIQQQSLLAMNVYGGTVWKLNWEPWSFDLPYRLAVRHVKNPSMVKPVWDDWNPWRMLECYIGYEISRETALAKYGVDAQETLTDKVLVIEHWTQERWVVRVDGKIPTLKWQDKEWRLEGENKWGRIPVYYIPHEPTFNLFGESQIDTREELSLEINSRIAQLGDIIQSSHPGVVWGKNLGSDLTMRRVVLNGQVLFHVVDTGRGPPGGTKRTEPELDSLPMPNVPDAIAELPKTLLDFWMMVNRLSPSLFGLDDTMSGRITGRAIQNRMWTSLAHALSSRLEVTEAKNVLDKDIIHILDERKESLSDLGIEPPKINDSDKKVNLSQKWWPSVPLDELELNERLTDDFRYGAISPQRFYTDRGYNDVDEETIKLKEWLRFKEEIKRGNNGENTDNGSEEDSTGYRQSVSEEGLQQARQVQNEPEGGDQN